MQKVSGGSTVESHMAGVAAPVTAGVVNVRMDEDDYGRAGGKP